MNNNEESVFVRELIFNSQSSFYKIIKSLNAHLFDPFSDIDPYAKIDSFDPFSDIDPYAEIDTKINSLTSLPQLSFVIKKFTEELVTEDLNEQCKNDENLFLQREKLLNDFNNLFGEGKYYCQYSTTIHAIFNAVEFLDLVARKKENLEYELTIEDKSMCRKIINDMINNFPNQIIIPTFEDLNMFDLIKMRTIPVHFVKINKNFELINGDNQSPIEKFLNDIQKASMLYRNNLKTLAEIKKEKMYSSDNQVGLYKEHESQYLSFDLTAKQNYYCNHILSQSTIFEDDSDKIIALKTMKKCILLDLCYVENKNILPDTLLETITSTTTDFSNNSFLSNFRQKLENGFFDKFQEIKSLDSIYKTKEFIAESGQALAMEICFILKNQANGFNELNRSDYFHSKINYDYLLDLVRQPTMKFSMRKT